MVKMVAPAQIRRERIREIQMTKFDGLRRKLLAGRGKAPLRNLGLEVPLPVMQLVSMK